ncbi:MAG: tyrosine--tRNA ligase [Candidatus Parcubacteria bacterium]|nr:tyrosine--tRNA ligase [Candidatus Paceibacterota bacterium]
MSNKYDLQTLKKAILFNVREVLPTDPAQLDKELEVLIEQANLSGEPIRHYIGFEVSGQIHIGGGFFPMLQAAKLQQAGVEIILWIADYHTYLNNKLDGKLETIKTAARDYFGPTMKECFRAAGGNPETIKILYNFDDYRQIKNDQTFWDYEFQIDKKLTLNRVLRSMSIMGRDSGGEVEYQMTRYPGMQCADVFWLQAHICQGGLDQRKIYVSARDLAYTIDPGYQLKINNKTVKPITVMCPLLSGLLPPETDNQGNKTVAKMSKSKPDSAIWVHDSLSEIQRKIKKAYCPMIDPNLSPEENQTIQNMNPILDWCQNMLYPAGQIIQVTRLDKFGGNVDYTNYDSLYEAYTSGSLHPMDLKNAVASSLFKILKPIYDYTVANPKPLEYLLNIKKL